MKTTRAVSLCIALAVPAVALAQTPAAAPAAAIPTEFSGAWHFVNSTSGRLYGGDVHLRVVGDPTARPAKARISVDGRQNNDSCSTRTLFKDTPVDAEITPTDTGYRVTYALPCVRGVNPRPASTFDFVCKDGTCTTPTVNSFGAGAFVLRPGPPPAVSAADFRPYKLVGAWNFTNSNTGARYGGDVAVDIKSMESNGSMRGLLSYDGTQTNDRCSTKTLFSNDPVEAEVQKIDGGYRVWFALKCATGQNQFGWTLACKDGVCTLPQVLPHGKGETALREVR